MKNSILNVCKKSILRRNFFAHLLVLLLFCSLIIGNIFWRTERSVIGDHDQGLKSLAESFLGLSRVLNREATQSEFGIAFNMTEKMIQDQFRHQTGQSERTVLLAIRITDRKGLLIYQNLQAEKFPFESNRLNFYSTTVNEKYWRVFNAKAHYSPYVVEIAELRELANDTVYAVVRDYLVIPLTWFLPLAALITWFTSIRGLAPLQNLASTISKRNSNDMKPLQLEMNYLEFQPVVNEINGLLEKLEATLVRERAFLADAAHELRTPLAVIQAQAHVMQNAATAIERKQASDELTTGVERTAALIRKLLVSARLSTQDFAPNFVQTDLVALIQERITTFAILAEKRQLEMELTSPNQCDVLLDRDSFLSAIDNVIDNAINYSPAGGNITIQIEPDLNKQVNICVIDQGSGVPEALRKRVFERFFRVQGTMQLGSGLGLSIVDRVMVLHQGHVTLLGGPNNVGLCVKLSLPAA
jgi:signal transduction histidine kinase